MSEFEPLEAHEPTCLKCNGKNLSKEFSDVGQFIGIRCDDCDALNMGGMYSTEL